MPRPSIMHYGVFIEDKEVDTDMNSISNSPDDIDIEEMEKEFALLEKELKLQPSNTSKGLDHWYSPHYNHVRQLLMDRPHKQLEQMCKSERLHIINTNVRAFSVLANTLLYIRNELFRDQTYVVSITQSQVLGEEQRRMFEAISEVLDEWECQARLLFSKKKQRLQYSPIPPKTFLITSPRFLFELLIEPYWKQNYGVPSIILLTDLDAYPPRLFQAIVPLIRVILWQNPQIQVIINSETLGNSSQIARLFFGDKAPVIQIQGVKMRGETSFTCYRESDMPFSHLIIYLNEQTEKSKSGLLNPMYFHKEILYIRDQWVVDWLLRSEHMSDAFVVIHENLPQEEIIKRLDIFRTDPLKPCLITTDLIEGDYYLPHIRGGFFYGLPADPRTFLRIRNHICRIPQLPGRIRLVLRDTHPTEKSMTREYHDGTDDEPIKADITLNADKTNQVIAKYDPPIKSRKQLPQSVFTSDTIIEDPYIMAERYGKLEMSNKTDLIIEGLRIIEPNINKAALIRRQVLSQRSLIFLALGGVLFVSLSIELFIWSTPLTTIVVSHSTRGSDVTVSNFRIGFVTFILVSIFLFSAAFIKYQDKVLTISWLNKIVSKLRKLVGIHAMDYAPIFVYLEKDQEKKSQNSKWKIENIKWDRLHYCIKELTKTKISEKYKNSPTDNYHFVIKGNWHSFELISPDKSIKYTRYWWISSITFTGLLIGTILVTIFNFNFIGYVENFTFGILKDQNLSKLLTLFIYKFLYSFLIIFTLIYSITRRPTDLDIDQDISEVRFYHLTCKKLQVLWNLADDAEFLIQEKLQDPIAGTKGEGAKSFYKTGHTKEKVCKERKSGKEVNTQRT